MTKKLMLLASMALAAVAFAVPASASADIFTHSGEPASGQSANLSGSAGFVIAAETTRGVHCTTTDFTIQVTENTGHITAATFDGCTTTSPIAQEENLPTDATAINLANWVAEPDVANSRILITNVHINNKVTHPVTTHLVLAESTLKGTMVANIPSGQTSAIETVTLSDEGATVQVGIPPSGTEIEANVSGHLTSNGTIGIE